MSKDIGKESINDKDIKKSSFKDNYEKIIENIVYNLSNIKTLLLELKEYNSKISEELENKNFHCKTLSNLIHKKRILIFINYKKIYEIFVTLIKYFSHHAITLTEKLDNDKNYLFLVGDLEEDETEIFANTKKTEDLHNNLSDNNLSDNDLSENDTSEEN